MAPYDFSAPRLFVRSDLRADAAPILDQAQRNYLCNVLRLKEGSAVLVFNGRDGEWRARLAVGGAAGDGERRQGKAAAKAVTLAVREQVRPQSRGGDLHLLFAPLKHARLDYMVQKAVEMGASALRPVLTRRTQAARLNLERMEANAIEAAEQCGILALPELREPQPLDAALAGWEAGRRLVFCDEDAAGSDPLDVLRQAGRGTPLAVLIGPEGGFDEAERATLLALPHTLRISLGPRILRADTAAVAALALVQAAAGDNTLISPDCSPRFGGTRRERST